jgi:TonB family protein
MESLRPVDEDVFPHYPAELRNAGIEGKVVASFPVDSTGRVDARSVRITSSTDPQFSRSVCKTLPLMRIRRADGKPLLSPARTSADFTFRIG